MRSRSNAALESVGQAPLASKGAPGKTIRTLHGADRPAPIKRRDAEATRTRILQAAMQEFAAKGLDARVEDIAEIAGANRRMAYYYFGSKEGLYLAALEATYFELVKVENSIDVNALGPLEAIATLVSAKFEHYVKYPHYIEFVKIENLYQARHLKTSRRIAEMRTPLISIIKRVLQQGQASGVLRKGIDPLDLYISICALGFFVFSNKYTLGTIFNANLTSPKALNRRRSVIIEMLTAYLRPTAKRKRDSMNRPQNGASHRHATARHSKRA
jgi:TetR/AcrR family transcriptional regulator